jgi:hypothetical protein
MLTNFAVHVFDDDVRVASIIRQSFKHTAMVGQFVFDFFEVAPHLDDEMIQLVLTMDLPFPEAVNSFMNRLPFFLQHCTKRSISSRDSVTLSRPFSFFAVARLSWCIAKWDKCLRGKRVGGNEIVSERIELVRWIPIEAQRSL